MNSNVEQVKGFASPGMACPTVIFEQVANGSYLVYDRTEGKFQARDDPRVFFYGNMQYVPLQRLPWPSVTLPKDYESEEQLFNEIRSFYVEHLDVSNELLFDVYAAFTLASWRAEDFSVIPYAFFLGPLASGKTRALECFHRLCYRSIMATSMSAASLFRALEAWHPSLLLDETEIYNRDCMVEVLALLNSGYRRGQYAIRIEKIEEGCPQIAFFDTFGFKVLAGTEELAATLQSRCVITSMSKAVRHVNLFVNEDKAQELRNKLMTYRFKNLGKKLENFDVSTLNGYFNNARVIELFVSLLHVAPTEEIRTRLVECMKQITQTRLDEEQASIEARVFDAILGSEEQVESGKLSTQAITEAFNKGLSEKDQATSRFIGRKVTGLGFEKCKLSRGGLAGFFWDTKQIERLKARYCPTPSKTTPLTPLTPHSPQPIENKGGVPPAEQPTSGESREYPPRPPVLEASRIFIKNGECRDNRDNGVNLEETQQSIQEIIETLRPKLTGPFLEQQLIDHLTQTGLTRDKADRLIKLLIEQSMIARDPDGNWSWVK
jgi:hypothetical protein